MVVSASEAADLQKVGMLLYLKQPSIFHLFAQEIKGLVECIVAAASARVGKKVLHIDKNDYYGGQWASFTLQGIEQWVTGFTSLKGEEEEEKVEAEECVLEEGEKLLATSDPGRGYTKVKRQWHVKKEDEVLVASEVPVTPSEISTENSCDTQEEKVQETEACSETAVAEVESEKNCAVDSTNNEKKDIAPPVEAKEKFSWSQESMMKLTRRFNLDLAPKLLFSRGSLVELLISSNVARYAEFKCITRVLTWLASGDKEGELVVVPCSRSDVFTTNSVSLVEKRLLMKLLEFCHSYDQHPEQLEEFADKTFIDFLKSRRQTPNLIHFVTEAIAMVDGDVSCSEGLEKTKLFLTSLGRYGTTPFLFSMYGCGELPQAFCRLCAVFEGTYVLRRPISSIIMNSSNSCVGLLSEGKRFKCSHLVIDAMYSPSQYLPVTDDSSHKRISRGIFIIDRSILPNEKEQLTLLRLPVKGDNVKPITILEVGFGAGVCPKDLYCVHMTCQGYNAEEDLKVAVDRLFASEDDADTGKPTLLWSLYFNQVDMSNVDLVEGNPENIYLCSGPDILLDYDSAISQARSLFTRMFPDEEFLPRAPDPDEIVFDNVGAEPKQGDNFSSGESAEKKEDSGEESAEKKEDSGEESAEKKEDSGEESVEKKENKSNSEDNSEGLSKEESKPSDLEAGSETKNTDSKEVMDTL